MLLALDVGNSQIYGGVYDGENILFNFRKSSRHGTSSDEFGIFFKSVLLENGVRPEKITDVAICTVVPDLLHSIRGGVQKYFGIHNPFILQAGVKTGLNIKYRNPAEVGADRIANAIGAFEHHTDKNLVIVDFGTATTFCAINRLKEYLGGMIIPGLRLSMEALESGTARLPTVEILNPKELVGRSTVESIQSGLYFSNVFVVREAAKQIKKDYFNNEPTWVIGTGGFSRLFEKEGIFDELMPDLVLSGLKAAHRMNSSTGEGSLRS